jgi:transcriptional regulator of arginine metabolism
MLSVMQRELAKADRQRLVTSLIARKRVGTQFELRDALAAEGCVVTQATLSRDVRELGLEKTRDPLGRPRYIAPRDRAGRDDPEEGLRRVLAEFGRRATAAQNIVVVHSELGSAPAIGRALDRLEHEKIVGTLAGDDTCLIVTANAADARALAAELAAGLG